MVEVEPMKGYMNSSSGIEGMQVRQRKIVLFLLEHHQTALFDIRCEVGLV